MTNTAHIHFGGGTAERLSAESGFRFAVHNPRNLNRLSGYFFRHKTAPFRQILASGLTPRRGPIHGLDRCESAEKTERAACDTRSTKFALSFGGNGLQALLGLLACRSSNLVDNLSVTQKNERRPQLHSERPSQRFSRAILNLDRKSTRLNSS